MAVFIRGRDKGKTVKVLDIQGEWAYILAPTGERLINGQLATRVRLGMLQVDHDERQRILQSWEDSETFKFHYDWGHFLRTSRFRKLRW